MKNNIFVRFKDDQRGTATVESLLWMPLFFYLFILITDVSFIFFGKAQALRIIQDGNRAFSVGDYQTMPEAETEIQTSLRTIAPTATATSTLVGGAIIQTVGELPMNELMAVGSIPFAGENISITAQHFIED